MAVDAELGAIIGGCVAGAIVLIAITAVIVCLCCGKRRRRKKDREQKKKLQQLTPHTTPSHSQPSSLGHGGVPQQPPSPGDPRLPKVGSNGLWLGTPGIYAATPSPAYYYGRPGAKPPQHFHPHPHHGGIMQPAVMQRASSESRIPQHRDRHVPGGPGIYPVGGGSQQRIYHSQQLASLTPLYEVVDPRNGSIYDVYQIGGGSKTKLLQDSGGRSSGDRHSKKVQRSQSDANYDPSSKRPHRHQSSQDGGHRSSKTGSGVTKETAQVHQPKDKASDEKDAGGMTNAAFVGSSEKIAEAVKTAAATSTASATDSMKILAKNKTDDEKKVVSPASTSDTEVTKRPSPMPVPAPDPSLHYTYGGDIYAVPDKEESKRRSRSENPILARMQDMILERAEGGDTGQAPDPITDLTETHEPLIVTSVYRDPPGDHGASLIQNPIYQEVEEVVSESRPSDLATAQGLEDSTSEIAAAVRAAAAADELDREAPPHSAGDNVQASGDAVDDDAVLAAVSSVVTSLRDDGAGAGGEAGEQQDTTAAKASLEPRWSMDTDAATDEISRAGKHISVTAEAFEFLDTYLSDEDVADTHQSPPSSPVTSGGDELMY